MADDDECPRITIEPAFQPVNRGKIKMVRRLIEQQQIRLTSQSPANGPSAALTARCGFGQTRKIDAKLIRDCLHLMPGQRLLPTAGETMTSFDMGAVRLLLQHRSEERREGKEGGSKSKT